MFKRPSSSGPADAAASPPAASGTRQRLAANYARIGEASAPVATKEILPRPMPPAPPLGQRLTETKFILLDVESTSADPLTTHVIEIAAQGWSLNPDVRFPRVFEAKINPGPGVFVPPSSSAVHHITDEDLVGCPTMEQILPQLQEVIGNYPIVAYNSEFDRTTLHATPFHDRYWLDVFRLAMRTWHIGQENAKGFALTSLKQQELRYWLGLPRTQGDAHRAAADIMVTGLVFREAASRYLNAGLPDDFNAFASWLASPILHKTIPIGAWGTVGKTPEELEDWQLRKMLDPSNPMAESLGRFNVLDFVRPEYLRRGLDAPHSTRPRPSR